jgi:hypothetical protein
MSIRLNLESLDELDTQNCLDVLKKEYTARKAQPKPTGVPPFIRYKYYDTRDPKQS